MNYEYVMTSDGELYHYGVKGMRWGHRKAVATASDKKWAKAKHQPSSAKSSALAGLYAATGNERIGKALDKSNDKDAKRWAEAKQKVAKTKAAIKDYRNKWDDAEKAENDADAKWASVKEQYKALGKNRISRMLNAGGKSDAANKYRKAWDEAEEASNIADTKWNEVSEAYKKTGRNRVEAIINNIEYDRERKRK